MLKTMKIFSIIAFFIFIQVFLSTNLVSKTINSTSNQLTIELTQSSTYTISVFHDGFWWIQIYDSDTNSLIKEYLDPEQS